MRRISLILSEYREEDSEKLARFFNESEEGWPGGFTGGVEVTADQVREQIRSSRNLAVLLAEADGRIVGYLSMTAHWIDRNAGYISLLNVHPEYRRRGIGTSLLREAIWRAVKLGLDRVDIHTWSGNIGALRVYKRMVSCGSRAPPCTCRTTCRG